MGNQRNGFAVVKQPSGEYGFAIQHDEKVILLSGNPGDLLFWQIEAELQKAETGKEVKVTNVDPKFKS